MFEPYVAVKQSCILGESPIWCAAEQALYWVDIRNPMIYRWDPVSGDMQQRIRSRSAPSVSPVRAGLSPVRGWGSPVIPCGCRI